MGNESLDDAKLTNIALLESFRWGDNPVCPYCSSPRVSTYVVQQRYYCNNCNTSFSVTVRTPFHNTKISLEKWFEAISILVGDSEDLSGRELARRIQVNRNTGCRMALMIQTAMYREDQRLMLLKIAESYGKPQGSNPHDYFDQ